MSTVTILDLMTDPDLFGAQFSGESWAAWRALLAGFYGLPLDEEELTRTFHQGSGVCSVAGETVWLIVRKSIAVAMV